MRSALHCLLLFSALWTLSFCGTRQFYVVKEEKNWTEAQEYCREKFTDLATIENQEEMNTVKAAVNKTTGNCWVGLRQNPDQKNRVSTCIENQEEMDALKAEISVKTDSFWIGLRQDGDDINRSWIWSDGSNSSYTDWKPKEPNNNGSDNCVEIIHEKKHTYGKWNDAGCHWKKHFICYKEVPLILIKEEKMWKEALRYCRENHVDLVSVHTQEIQRWVETVTRKTSTDNVWVGLRHTCTLSFWFWVSGEFLCYQNWAPGNGTGVEDCSNGERSGAVQSGSGKWVSLPQTQTLNFICTTE